MIYFGDGETDVPCMKIVGMFGGNSIAVYNPSSEKKRASALKLKRQGRVAFATPAVYTPSSRTYKVVCAIIDKIKAMQVWLASITTATPSGCRASCMQSLIWTVSLS